MSKVRVYEVAKQLNLDPKAVVSLFQAVGVTEVRNHMSSVEPEAVDRVRRHLEKQKTHDVVEERVRPTVVKRRAVAKPADSAAQIPQVAASSPSLVEDAPRPPTSSPSMRDVTVGTRENGHPQTDVLVRDRESGSVRNVAQEERKSSRDVESAIPVERKSSRDMVAAIAEMAADDVAAPAAPPSERTLAPIEAEMMAAAEEAAASRVEEPAPPPAVAAPVTESVPPSTQTPSVRPSTAPKTGIEYWGGRAGVPMPTPEPRMGPKPTGPGMKPRPVQYDPKGWTTGPGGPNRGPHTPHGRPMSGGRGGRPGQPQWGPGRGMITRKAGGAPSTKEMSEHKKVIRIEENITLQGMAAKMSLKSTELMMKLIGMGTTGIHINTTLDADTAKILASEFGWEVEDVAVSEEASLAAARGETAEANAAADKEAVEDLDRHLRSPVVTVMGHVDHGKTSLLDRIRKANVASGEAGGITQHIGAYKVATSHGPVVFLDTPGHEAFTQMRARGASVTDLVILVVAADDGVMPQTKEAVNHAKAAGVPIVVAVNKIDKPGAEPERVRRELVELGLQPEEWGGDTMFVDVSAQTGAGIDQLLENIGLQAEVLELKANPKKPASGTVIEALLDRGRGPVARVLVQDGTLRVGDFVLAGPGFGKVRAMTNEHGKQVQEAGPSTPVEILGLSDVPNAGDPMHAVKDSKKAQEIAETRKRKMQGSLKPASGGASLEEIAKRISSSNQQELRVIIKGDVQGSVEAVADTLAKLTGEKVKLTVIHSGVGAITEGDVNLAIAVRAIIIGFNVRPAGKAATHAEENKVEIRTYSIIYNAVDDIKSAMEGLLPPTLVEKETGKAEVRATFKGRNGNVAGCYVVQGQIKRNGRVRVKRDGAVIWDGKIDALKRFKDDVKDVQEGFECGISLDGFGDVKEKDMIEAYEIEEIKQKL